MKSACIAKVPIPAEGTAIARDDNRKEPSWTTLSIQMPLLSTADSKRALHGADDVESVERYYDVVFWREIARRKPTKIQTQRAATQNVMARDDENWLEASFENRCATC